MEKIFYQRQELAWDNAGKDSEEYELLGNEIKGIRKEICKQISEEYILTLNKYDELETKRHTIEGEALYMQGLRDGYKLKGILEG